MGWNPVRRSTQSAGGQSEGLLSGCVRVLAGSGHHRRSRTQSANPARASHPRGNQSLNPAELMKVSATTWSWAGRIVRFGPYRAKNDLAEPGVVTSESDARIRDSTLPIGTRSETSGSPLHGNLGISHPVAQNRERQGWARTRMTSGLRSAAYGLLGPYADGFFLAAFGQDSRLGAEALQHRLHDHIEHRNEEQVEQSGDQHSAYDRGSH